MLLNTISAKLSCAHGLGKKGQTTEALQPLIVPIVIIIAILLILYIIRLIATRVLQ